MDTLAGLIIAGFALVLVVEGLAYAFFTDAIRKMMAEAVKLPTETLRNFGLIMGAIGVFLLWVGEKFL